MSENLDAIDKAILNLLQDDATLPLKNSGRTGSCVYCHGPTPYPITNQ